MVQEYDNLAQGQSSIQLLSAVSTAPEIHQRVDPHSDITEELPLNLQSSVPTVLASAREIHQHFDFHSDIAEELPSIPSPSAVPKALANIFAVKNWTSSIAQAIKQAYPERLGVPVEGLRAELKRQYEKYYITLPAEKNAYHSDSKDKSRTKAVRKLQVKIKNKSYIWVSTNLKQLLGAAYPQDVSHILSSWQKKTFKSVNSAPLAHLFAQLIRKKTKRKGRLVQRS